MAEEEQLLDRYRRLPERERKNLVAFADELFSRRDERKQGPVSDAGRRRERSDLGRYRWEQAGF